MTDTSSLRRDVTTAIQDTSRGSYATVVRPDVVNSLLEAVLLAARTRSVAVIEAYSNELPPILPPLIGLAAR
jgi:hypothetical protein